MRWMALLAVGVAPLMLLLGTSCEDSGGETAAVGGSGAGGAGGATTTSSSTSTGSPDCHGDPAAWDAVQKSNIPCANNSDCCVVFNSCTAAGQIVGSDDFPGAGDLWPWCEDECVFCAFPLIEVECVDQLCVGYEVPVTEDAGAELGEPHCGEDDVVLQLPGPAMMFPCL